MTNTILNSIWPEWQVDKLLGSGAYGEVYKAVRRDHLESYAAIKVISIPKNESEVDTLRLEGMLLDETETYFWNVVDDFVKEIQFMETFKGTQNIVSVEDYKVVKKEEGIGWDIYIRMELLTPLDRFFYDHSPNESEAIKIGIDICTALEMCARRSVIHRDIKPENIFVNSFGDFKLGDFGIARTLGNASTSMTQVGTPYYLAPEITKSNRYDATVDIYSLGIVLYRYTNDNRLPFIEPGQNTSPSERQRALMRRFDGEPLTPPCKSSRELSEVILTACAYEPSRRYRTPIEMKNALIAVANGTYKHTGTLERFETEKIAYAEKTTDVRSAEGAQESTYYAERFDSNIGIEQSSERPNRQLEVERTSESHSIARIKIALIVCVVIAVLIVAFMFVVLSGLSNSKRSSDSKNSLSSTVGMLENSDSNNGFSSIGETTKYSASDEQKIAEIIKEAENLTQNDDYDAAYEKIQAGLVAYPNSDSLVKKEQEYYNIRYKRDTLATAKTFAEMDSFPEAIAAIKDAQTKQGACPEYQEALKEYTTAYRTAIIANADEAAAVGDYASALSVINDATSVLGEDTELSAKQTFYKNSYITDVIAKTDKFVANEEYASAVTAIDSALETFPDDRILQDKAMEIRSFLVKPLLEICPPYETHCYETPSKVSICGENSSGAFTLNLRIFGNSVDDALAIFNFGKNYETLEFDFGHVDGTELHSAKVTIFLNGEVYDEFTANPSDMLKHYKIDVSDVTQFRIVIGTGYFINTSYGVTNAFLTAKAE